MPDHLNESYRPLVAQWVDPLGKMFKDGYEELVRFRKKCTTNPSVLVDWDLRGFDYDTLGGNVTFEKIWDIIKN